jgi:hypothetical protein
MTNQIVERRVRSRIPLACVAPRFIVLVATSVLVGCSSTTELSSSWSDNQVTIDGNPREWGSGLTNLKDTKVFLAVRNDQDFVYLCLTSADRQFRRQVIGTGLTVWFESEDGHRVGVLYPIGMARQESQPWVNPGETPGGEERERMVEQALQDLEILGPGKDDKNLFSTVQSPGISVKVGGSQESGAYELKVPLRKSSKHPYAVEAAAGSTVKISIETGKFEPGSRPSGSGEGRHGEGGGGRPHGGGMPGGEMSSRNRPEPLNISVAVQLAGPTPGTQR